ncbi:ABC transporter ATP-binding protein [Sporofaciens musculi]|jgi:ABC-2 type transport system ATP-binding protein|uniref:ABC transporter ATP-binding protein n=1 Tax=Sporofaciens musculi TaxID=2681861 RepID=UPI00216EA14E|nr:ABC transporter ATP-binding protein [Sporofaciens musculi]MCI9422723.1 ABC transporter ATP-binding protein [Dorea sp.]
MSVIDIRNLTKDYGKGRGVFDLSLHVDKGVCYGFLGPNGAGKTTTIRHLMGFSKPQKGEAEIWGMNCQKHGAELKGMVGYLPGEIAFPKMMTGRRFLEYMRRLRRMEKIFHRGKPVNLGVEPEDAGDAADYFNRLLTMFSLDISMRIRDMSIGEKRKLAVVTAFMHDPDVLILDEPTSGLDPVMQEVFIDFIRSEKKRGKTIFLSSHIFQEVDAVCDRIAIIKDGRIAADFGANELKEQKQWIYKVSFETERDYSRFIENDFLFTNQDPKQMSVRFMVDMNGLNRMLPILSELNVADISEIPYTLEDHFMKFYRVDDEALKEPDNDMGISGGAL